jgi:DNA-binding transcriptional LysR family regulator
MDLAIRIGALKDSSLVARRIGSATRICVAGVDYLAAHGEPSQPADLLNHNCIVFTLASAGNVWAFRDNEVSVSGSFRVNTPDGIRDAVLGGMGIAYSPSWLFEDALRDGRVKPLLIGYPGPLLPIQFVYAANRLVPSRARVFMDFIATKFARERAFNHALTEP